MATFRNAPTGTFDRTRFQLAVDGADFREGNSIGRRLHGIR
jgi:hypothetical protein